MSTPKVSMSATEALSCGRVARSFPLPGIFWKTIVLVALLFVQSCSQQSHAPGNYSLYHVRTYNQFSDPRENYIKENANVVLHVSSQKLDRDFGRLANLASEGRKIAEFEANSLLVRYSDAAKYRLGSSKDCQYLVIFDDDTVACDKELYTSVFTQFESPLSERD